MQAVRRIRTMLRECDGQRENASRIRSATADLRTLLREPTKSTETEITHAGTGNVDLIISVL